MPVTVTLHLAGLCPTFRNYIPLDTTNKMQRYTIFFITVNALHVSGGFSAHHQELKNCTHSIRYVPGLLAATANGSSKQASCWLYLKEYINDARSLERQKKCLLYYWSISAACGHVPAMTLDTSCCSFGLHPNTLNAAAHFALRSISNRPNITCHGAVTPAEDGPWIVRF
jgi:hypothetical protein